MSKIASILLLALASIAQAQAAPDPHAAQNAAPSNEILQLRDPFKRPVIDLGRVVPKSELELYPIDSFRMVAVVTGPDRMRAMLRAPDGKSYMVFSGMRIGTRNGVIRRITAEAVEVRERIVNVLGQEENVDLDIPLMPDMKSAISAGR